MDNDRRELNVALIYDFDGTLAPGNMQEYDFIPAVGKSNAEFWEESNRIAEQQDADPILTYMSMMIEGARQKGLSLHREGFRRAGRNIRFFEGVREWFGRINAHGTERGLNILHYINSSGIKEMIEGTEIADEFKNIYACSFLYNAAGEAFWPAVAVNYTNKTQFIYKINKGVESVSDSRLVNQYLEENKRPVQFKHMIYIGDGTTDIPCMKLVKTSGGHSIAVYDPADHTAHLTMERLVDERRVTYVCPADYRDGSEIDTLVKTIIDKIYIDNRIGELSGRRYAAPEPTERAEK
jgi:phosphoserine phosphatase